MKKIKPFSSYLSAGLLVTAITAALFVKINWLAFPILGLTCGIATRSIRHCFMGALVAIGITFIIFFLEFYSHPPEPPALLFFGIQYIAAIFGASIGAALQLPHRRLTIAAIIGCATSLLALVCLSVIIRNIFREELRVLEMWEYITIVLAVPVLGFGTWWPVDVMNNRLQNDQTSSTANQCTSTPSSLRSATP